MYLQLFLKDEKGKSIQVKDFKKNSQNSRLGTKSSYDFFHPTQ